MDRLTNYILSANKCHKLKGRAHLGHDIMAMVDRVVASSGLAFDMDKLDRLVCDVVASKHADGMLSDIKLALQLYGEME